MAAMTSAQLRGGVRPIEMSVGSSSGLVLGMDIMTAGDEGDGAANSEDGSQTENDEVTKELESDEVDPESAEQEFRAEDAPEGAKVKRMPRPANPTPEERERHYPTHLPYTPWCKICVQAKPTEDPHCKRVNTKFKADCQKLQWITLH